MDVGKVSGSKPQSQRPSRSTIGEDDKSAESPTLTPASSVQEQPQVSRWSSIKDGWHHFLANLGQRVSAGLPIEDTEQPKYDRKYHRIQHSKLEDNEQGIPRFAAFQDSNDSFCMFRRFGDVAARILEGKQIELWTLTTKLRSLDKKDAADDRKKYRLSSVEHKDNWDPTQKSLLDEIEEKLTVYYKLLLQYTQVRDLDGVKERHHRSVYDFNINNRSFEYGEDAYLCEIDDFVSAKRSGCGKSNRVEEMIESYLQNNPKSRLHHLFMGNDEKTKTSKELNVFHLSRFRLGLAPKIAAVCLGTGVVFTLIFLLYLGALSTGKMLCTLGIFVWIFMVIISLISDITPHDFSLLILGYVIILMALVSNSRDVGLPIVHS